MIDCEEPFVGVTKIWFGIAVPFIVLFKVLILSEYLDE
jgi:hypothetical protein